MVFDRVLARYSEGPLLQKAPSDCNIIGFRQLGLGIANVGIADLRNSGHKSFNMP